MFNIIKQAAFIVTIVIKRQLNPFTQKPKVHRPIPRLPTTLEQLKSAVLFSHFSFLDFLKFSAFVGFVMSVVQSTVVLVWICKSSCTCRGVETSGTRRTRAKDKGTRPNRIITMVIVKREF